MANGKANQAQETKDAQMTAEEEAQAKVLEVIDHNLRFFNQGREVPVDALKPIKAGRLKGMSDVNPMWRMKRMTEIFGPVGFGWKYEIAKQWTEAYGNEVKCFCNVLLFVRDPETKEWSAPIPGNGGSAIVSMESKGAYVNDEGYKMALTDALSIAMKPLGIGGNVWYGPKANGHNESKYEADTRDQSSTQSQQNQQTSQSKGTAGIAYTGEQLKAALAELDSITTEDQFGQLWQKWANTCPALCMANTEFYKKACQKINQIKNPNTAK